MKGILFLGLLIIVLSATYSLAQMGHGMMREGHMTEQNGHMMHEKEMMGDKKMQPDAEMPMHYRQMMNGMMGATQDIAIMMRQMSVMMGDITEMENKARNQDMQRMSVVMKNMALEMNKISVMMGRGTATPEEVKAMRDRMIKMREQMRDLKRSE